MTEATGLCKCGHEKDAHYEYFLNGELATRCKECDPMTGHRFGPPVAAVGEPGMTAEERNVLIAMESDTYFSAMYFAADHDFEVSP